MRSSQQFDDGRGAIRSENGTGGRGPVNSSKTAVRDVGIRGSHRDGPPALQVDVNLPESLGYRIKRRVLGRPLVSEQLHEGIKRAAAELAAREIAGGDTEVTFLLPRRTYPPVIGRLLHDRTADAIADAVSKLPHIAAMIVPFDVVEAIAEHKAATNAAKHGEAPPERRRAPGPRRATRTMLLDATGAHDEPTGPVVHGSGPVPIGSVHWRDRAVVEGRVRSVSVSPVAGSPALECELCDDTGGITLVFYGRRQIAGIEPGTKMRAEGMVGEMQGFLGMANPTYVLLPRDHG
jgi:hypothetical protein